jgi:CDP-diacylglycerol---glycerol-3-phosphate 3-phosphatidyltransferase
MWANTISILRVLLAFVAISLLGSPQPGFYFSAFVLTLIVIWMDGLDGYVARKLNEASQLGAVIDILGDRVVEMTYWISFLALGWIPLWMPLLVMTRGIVVDGLRSMATKQGYTAFGATSLMQHPVGVFLVSSRASRWLYAVLKALTFSFAILAHSTGEFAWLWPWVQGCLYGTLFFCVIRGLPVLFELDRFIEPSRKVPGQSI